MAGGNERLPYPNLDPTPEVRYRLVYGVKYSYNWSMMNFLIRLFVNALALAAAAWLIDGIQMTGGFLDVLVVALVFGVLNAILKPILLFLSLPFLIVTLGLFALVINALMLMITANLLDDFAVAGFWAAVLGSIVISLVTMVLGGLLKDGEDD